MLCWIACSSEALRFEGQCAFSHWCKEGTSAIMNYILYNTFMSTIPLLLTVTKGGPPLFALQRYLPEQLKERAHLWLGNDHELPVEPHEVGVITIGTDWNKQIGCWFSVWKNWHFKSQLLAMNLESVQVMSLVALKRQSACEVAKCGKHVSECTKCGIRYILCL